MNINKSIVVITQGEELSILMPGSEWPMKYHGKGCCWLSHAMALYGEVHAHPWQAIAWRIAGTCKSSRRMSSSAPQEGIKYAIRI